jgi:hypothetical protein
MTGDALSRKVGGIGAAANFGLAALAGVARDRPLPAGPMAASTSQGVCGACCSIRYALDRLMLSLRAIFVMLVVPTSALTSSGLMLRGRPV